MLLTRPYERNVEGLASAVRWLGAVPVVLSSADIKRCRVVSTIGRDFESTTIEYGARRGDRLVLDEVRSIWSRGFALDVAPRTGTGASLAYQQWRYYTDYVVGKLQHAFWMNSHAAIQGANNRLLQMDVARRVGFRTPASLITNRADRALSFLHDHGGAIAKQISSGHPLECADRMLFAARVSSDDILRLRSNIGYSPTLFQEVVDKSVELRVYVVGTQVFCAGMRIDAKDHIDARSLIVDKHYFRFPLDEGMKRQVRELAAALNLRYAAIDLALTRLGELFFFEANPSGQWSYVEAETGHPITQAISEELVCNAAP